jgi:hypothetical protein
MSWANNWITPVATSTLQYDLKVAKELFGSEKALAIVRSILRNEGHSHSLMHAVHEAHTAHLAYENAAKGLSLNPVASKLAQESYEKAMTAVSAKFSLLTEKLPGKFWRFKNVADASKVAEKESGVFKTRALGVVMVIAGIGIVAIEGYNNYEKLDELPEVNEHVEALLAAN